MSTDRFDPDRKPTYQVHFTCLRPTAIGHERYGAVWSRANFATERQANHAIERWLRDAKLPGERHPAFGKPDVIPRGYDLFEMVRIATRDPLEEA